MPDQVSEEKVPYQDPNRFNLRTHETDARGRVRGSNLYRMYVRDGTQVFERPVNSGNLFYENNQPAGRVEIERNPAGKITKKTFDFEAEHKAYRTPANKQEEMEMKLMESDARAAAAEKELAAIKQDHAERDRTASKRVVGDEVHAAPAPQVAPVTQKGVSRSSKDAPVAAALTVPESSSTPKDPTSGHAAPVQPRAEAIKKDLDL